MKTKNKFRQTGNKKFSELSSKMKKTEIGLIPEDWEVKELQNIADYINEKRDKTRFCITR